MCLTEREREGREERREGEREKWGRMAHLWRSEYREEKSESKMQLAGPGDAREPYRSSSPSKSFR